MLKCLGIQLTNPQAASFTESELRLTLGSMAAGGHVSRRERLIIENALDLEEKVARRYMLPRLSLIHI